MVSAASAEPRGAERRREKRYEVDLPATLAFEGVTASATVSDLSPSGALITAAAGPSLAAGSVFVLELEEFGQIQARVVHAGQGFYGVQFLDAHLHRDRLNDWLRREAASG